MNDAAEPENHQVPLVPPDVVRHRTPDSSNDAERDLTRPLPPATPPPEPEEPADEDGYYPL